jgi:hypothetical protein
VLFDRCKIGSVPITPKKAAEVAAALAAQKVANEAQLAAWKAQNEAQLAEWKVQVGTPFANMYAPLIDFHLPGKKRLVIYGGEVDRNDPDAYGFSVFEIALPALERLYRDAGWRTTLATGKLTIEQP